jgi:hypothetical protein
MAHQFKSVLACLGDLEKFPHAVEFAKAIEFGDAAEAGEAVEAVSEVDEGAVVGFQRTVLQDQAGLSYAMLTLTLRSYLWMRRRLLTVLTSKALSWT